jgi:hypothetical protein
MYDVKVSTYGALEEGWRHGKDVQSPPRSRFEGKGVALSMAWQILDLRLRNQVTKVRGVDVLAVNLTQISCGATLDNLCNVKDSRH